MPLIRLKNLVNGLSNHVDQVRIHVFVVVWNFKHVALFVFHFSWKVSPQLLTVLRLHDQHKIRPLQVIAGNRASCVATGSGGTHVDAWTFGIDLLSRGTSPLISAANE